LRRTQGQQSEGVYSSSTNNLEKAYEDLEREILEIKMKLQGSSIGPSRGPADQHQHMSQQQPDLAQSLGSTGLLQRSQGAAMTTGTFQPAHSMTAHNPNRSNSHYYNDVIQNTAHRTAGNRST